MSRLITRRRALLGLGVAVPAAALALKRPDLDPSLKARYLQSGEWLSYRAHRLLGAGAMAREYPESAMSPKFPMNGNKTCEDPEYKRHLAAGFVDWRLEVGGLVDRPTSYSLADLKAMPTRTQITRHDCVEGWSAIGKWTGVPLSEILDRVGLKPDAKFIAFTCGDKMWGEYYYESVDLIDAYHPQTILAYGMNDQALGEGYGAPLRLRVERQLGYKHAKFVMKVEAHASLSDFGYGKGGIWSDAANYEWYAGI